MRLSSEISIYKADGTLREAVPITIASRRRWKLMEEDNITLSFNLAESVDFAIGDYIDDEVFGHFVISEDPLPADYDPATGAYKNTLRFDADWIFWKNYILMLPYNGMRRETTWVLTDTLRGHLEVIRQNLYAIGYSEYDVAVGQSGSRIVVENTVEDPGKAVCITYSGTSILDALKALADAYECEFWLSDDVDGNDNPTRVVHFGKCEVGEEWIPLSMTDEDGREINVENMVPARNDSEYGNRFYVYGSTKNLPETYRKHLSFKADTTSRIGGYTAFKDSLRPMFPDFLKRSIVQTSNPTQQSYEDAWLDYSYTEEEDHDEMITWKNIRVEKTTAPIPVVQGWPFTVTPYNSPYGSFEYTVYIYGQGGNLLASSTNVLTPLTYTIPEEVDKITVRYSYEDATHLYRPAPLAPTVEWLDNTEYAYFAMVSYAGGTFLVRLEDGWFRAVSSRTDGVTYMNPPAGFAANTEYTLLATGDDAIKVANVPFSYYTDDDDTTDSVRILGERRLMLPRPPYTDADLEAIGSHIENGYVQREALSRDQIVERVVFFDEIYPRCALRITRVDMGEYANDTTYSDGSVKIANLPAYTIQAQLVTRSGDVDFPFDPETMMVVGKLTATFLTPDEAKVYSGRTTENACLLMGMTFDVACNRSNGVTTYQLAWNADYGEKLPNEILMPKVGDCFILAGWNPAMMSSLGLMDAAEKELALTADRYAELLEEAQFTFECHMMSDWLLARCNITHIPFITSDGKVFHDSNGNVFRVVGPYDTAGLFPMGQKVVVHHGALKSDKQTRVIGFEYKLDIPYDTPKYTVGESDTYSRLREIEKSIHASSQSTSASSNTTSVNIADGGDSSHASGGWQTLHLSPGTMAGMSPVDYNGSEEKSFRVPSIIDHLVDSDKVPRIAQTEGGDKVLVDKEGNELSGKQFFEEKVDPVDSTKKYISLKSGYTGLASVGWLAAGGVGTEGGGGGVSFLKELSDVYHNDSNVLRADGTGVQPGDALVYDTTHGWVAAVQSGGISSVVLSAGSANGTLKLTVNGVAGSDVSVTGLGSFAYKNSLSASDIPSLSYLPLSGGELSGDLRLKGSSNYGRTLRFGDGDYAYIKEDTDDHLKIYAANGIELSTGSGYDVTINGVTLDWFTVETIDNSPTLKLNPRYAGIWAEGWVAAGGVGTGSGSGGTYIAGDGINISSNNVISVVAATTSVLGGVKVDGTTIAINNNGVISAIGGSGGGISSVSLASGTNDGTLKLTVDGSVTDNIAVTGLSSLAYKSSLVASDIPDISDTYVTLSGTQTITGAKTFTTNPVTIGSDSGLSVNASSYIDIGNARLVYDSGANALHITKKSGTSATIGFFADGFVASGGVAGQTTSSYVDFESNQTIGGNKTFTGTTTLGNVTGPITLSGALNGLSIIKDSNNYVSLRASRIDIQDNGNNLFLCRGGGKVFLCANPGGTVSQKLYLDSSSTAIAQAWNTHSDIRLKEDIETVSKADAIEKVMALNPVRWRWKSGGLSAGLIAQEVEKVLPFMVTDGEYKGLAYQMLHAYEVSAIQSHEERIRQLERENEYLRSEIRALKS